MVVSRSGYSTLCIYIRAYLSVFFLHAGTCHLAANITPVWNLICIQPGPVADRDVLVKHDNTTVGTYCSFRVQMVGQ